MEAWLSLCFIALSAVLALWFLKPSSGESKPGKRLPPGPWTLPIIGSLHHVVSVLPHHTIAQLSRRYGPLMLLKLGELPTVVVSSAEAAALVMKTHDVAFANRKSSVTLDIAACGGNGIIFAPYGDRWRQMRKICVMELLSSKCVKRMEGVRAEEVGHLLRSIAASNGAVVNVSEKVSALSNSVASRAFFGGKLAQQDVYLREFHQVMELMGGFCLVDLFPSSRLVRWLSNGERRMKKSYGSIRRIIGDIIERRKAERLAGGACGAEDEGLLDALLRMQEEDSLASPLTTDAIGTVLFDILGAATETTGLVLAWTMSQLMNNPEAMSKAQLEVRRVLGQDKAVITNTHPLVELQYMQMVIKEVLRLHPPSPLVARAAREDCQIMGYDILKGTTVYVNVYAISRDPKYWENPDSFKPERFETKNMDYNGTYFEFTPFGAGRRQCPGMLFSSAIMEIVLANFLYHFDWKLPDGASPASLDMSEKFGLTVGRKFDLQLKAIPQVWSNAMEI
ncbi:desmethyl-deoxy-podophyllotoxin synthase isoform X1 [Aegilops tauschii subsp. strangulata]|uniref:Cytochrome P450 71D7 n=2 Tax=Aegilops tauschii subsp. strangulata TaxID=200361 RepID=A0A453E8G8_AEGTS|nr:desmethyl-deoxy-podophyllotoxin synthase [Aegilops tauschii subsp. strangulata]